MSKAEKYVIMCRIDERSFDVLEGFYTIKEAIDKYVDGCQAKIQMSAKRLVGKSVMAGVMIGIALLCISTVIAGIMPLTMMMISLISISILVAAYAAMITISNEENAAIEYGESLSLFCKNLLPRIWKIRK